MPNFKQSTHYANYTIKRKEAVAVIRNSLFWVMFDSKRAERLHHLYQNYTFFHIAISIMIVIEQYIGYNYNCVTN